MKGIKELSRLPFADGRSVWPAIMLLSAASACFAAGGQPPPPPAPPDPSNQTYVIDIPQDSALIMVTTNSELNGDDNLVWSHSGRYIAVDRTDPNVQASDLQSPKYIHVVDVSDLANIGPGDARSSATNYGVLANITDWTCNDDRILFGHLDIQTSKSKIMSCASSGDVVVEDFLKDPSNLLHVFSPSVVFDPAVNKERLLFLVSSTTNIPPDIYSPEGQGVVNLYTVTYEPGGVPNWEDRVALTAFTNNCNIVSVKWCPELGTNYQPLVNRYAMVRHVTQAQEPPKIGKALSVFTGVRDILDNAANPPVSLAGDPRISTRDTLASPGSQVSWTFDGVYLLYSKESAGAPPLNGASPKIEPQILDVICSVPSAGDNTNFLVYATPPELGGKSIQWLNISPNGMRVAFTADKKAYIRPMLFENEVYMGEGVTNMVTDGGYTYAMIPGSALDTNCTFSIEAPNTVDTNNFSGILLEDSSREFMVSGFTNEHFQLETNADLFLHFSEEDVPVGVSYTNLGLFIYEPTKVENGRTGSWSQVESMVDSDNGFVYGSVTQFSIYAIGVARETAVQRASADYDGDGKTDITVYEPGTGYWYIYLSGTLDLSATKFGNSDCTPISGDYDGDGKADLTVFERSTGYWYVYLSSTLDLSASKFGNSDCTPISGDYDGDGKADLTVFERSTGYWYVYLSSTLDLSAMKFGNSDCTPVW